MQKIYETNSIAIKTHHDTTQRKVANKIICQGEPWGPIECSLEVDNIGKESLNTELDPYKYKDIVEIPALGWIDDVITVSESGYKTARLKGDSMSKVRGKRSTSKSGFFMKKYE